MLSVIGCKLVDDVLIDAPTSVDQDMIASLNISVVVTVDMEPQWQGFMDRQSVAKDMSILKLSHNPAACLSLDAVIERLNDNRARYEKKFETKKRAEDEYYDTRYKRDSRLMSAKASNAEDEDMPKQ